MFGHKDNHREAKNDYEEFKAAQARGEHKGHLKAAGFATFLALEVYSHNQEKHGKEGLGTMKKVMASLAVAEIDKLVEQNVIPAAEAQWHKEKAIKHAHACAEERYAAQSAEEDE